LLSNWALGTLEMENPSSASRVPEGTCHVFHGDGAWKEGAVGLIETIKKSTEQRNHLREEVWPDETDVERRQRILRQKMRVYPVRSPASENRVATESDNSRQNSKLPDEAHA
jgi:hypothetical protein